MICDVFGWLPPVIPYFLVFRCCSLLVWSATPGYFGNVQFVVMFLVGYRR